MSDPVTNVAVEDVLSSIRRLVSEDNRFETRPAQPVPAAQVERLILTPAQRVEPLGDGADRAFEATSDNQEVVDPQAPWSDPNATLHGAAQLADDAEVVEAQGETDSFAPEVESTDIEKEQVPAAEDTQGSHGQEASVQEAEMVEMIDPEILEADVLAFVQADDARDDWQQTDDTDEAAEVDAPYTADAADAAPEPDDVNVQVEPAEEIEAGLASEVDASFEAKLDEELASVLGAETMEEAAPAPQSEPQFDTAPEIASEVSPDPSPAFSSVREPIEAAFIDAEPMNALDAAEEIAVQTEMNAPSDGPEASVAQSHTSVEDDNLTAKIRAVEAAVNRNASADWDEDPSETALAEPQPMAWQDLEYEHPEVGQAEVLAEPEGTALSDEEAILDEEALREMVADIVRQELQGVLGERITRNVRKLVRREIQRALSAQELE